MLTQTSAEYLAAQLALAEARLQEVTEPEDVAFWRARLTELERRALRLLGVVGAQVPGGDAARSPDEQ